MNTDSVLLDILRCELDATNHQFTHILALKQWGYDAAAARITEIDDIDFVNAMRIIDYLVSRGKPFTLRNPEFNPGSDLQSILQAEQSSETRLLAALGKVEHLDSTARAFADGARAPRDAYASWLDQEIASIGPESTPGAIPVAALHDLVAQLITLIEQTLIHAYVEWRGGCEAAADVAWLSSGAAMMHLTRLVNLCAKLPSVPVASRCPAPDIQHRPGETLAADLDLARHCTQTAREAAEACEYPGIARYCRTVANSYQACVDWDGVQPHPDLESTPPVFHSFQATLHKFSR